MEIFPYLAGFDIKSVKMNFSKNLYLGFQTSHRAKISHFQNMLGFIQYGLRSFVIADASSDPAKFQDDWPFKSWLNVKIKNQKLTKNGEFDK